MLTAMTNDHLNQVHKLLSTSAQLVGYGVELESDLEDPLVTNEMRYAVENAISCMYAAAVELREQARKVCENG